MYVCICIYIYICVCVSVCVHLGILKFIAFICSCVLNCGHMAPKSGPQRVNVNTSKRSNGASETEPNKKAACLQIEQSKRNKNLTRKNEQNFTLFDMAKSHTSTLSPGNKRAAFPPNLNFQIEKSPRNKFLPENWAAFPLMWTSKLRRRKEQTFSQNNGKPFSLLWQQDGKNARENGQHFP